MAKTKKKILFVMNNLNVGGAEKALVSMLQVFDYEKYEVDLLLFKKEGLFLNQIPAEVNLLAESENYKYFDMPFTQVIKENIFRNWNVIFRRLQFNLAVKKAKNSAEAEQFGWKPLSKAINPLPQHYDVAIGFLEKNPNYFVVDKVIGDKKIGFIHNDYQALAMNPKFDQPYFNSFHNIVTVSKDCKIVLEKVFPDMENKFSQISNIIAQETVCKLSEYPKTTLSKNSVISIGRLTQQKNYELAIHAFKILKQREVFFKWYILGEGHLHSKLLKELEVAGLSNEVELMGVKENPYPYLKQADIFLLSSHFEGDGIVVREAKILNKPIILTNFNTAEAHIQNRKNGIIVNFNAEELANSLQELLLNENIRKKFSNELALSDWGTESEIEKLYQLIES